MRGEGKGGRTSTDNTTRCDCSGDVRSRRKYIDTPPSSIALIICTLPRRNSIFPTALQSERQGGNILWR